MSEEIEFKCPDCGELVIYYPNANDDLIAAIEDINSENLNKEVEVKIYLECVNGHIKPYRIKKSY